mgnify:CR=1 FL=1
MLQVPCWLCWVSHLVCWQWCLVADVACVQGLFAQCDADHTHTPLQETEKTAHASSVGMVHTSVHPADLFILR